MSAPRIPGTRPPPSELARIRVAVGAGPADPATALRDLARRVEESPRDHPPRRGQYPVVR